MSRILCDYDMTLANTFIEQIAAVNTEFGTNYVHEDFKTWRSEDVLTEEEAAFMWGPRVFMNEDFQQRVEPVKGAIEGMNALLAEGHHCMIISDRPVALFEVTRDWLDRQGLEMVRLLFTRHKHSMNPAVQSDNIMTKAQAAWSYKLDTIIEDAMHHAKAFADREWIDRVYMLDTPHNREFDHPKVVRCYGWEWVTAYLTNVGIAPFEILTPA